MLSPQVIEKLTAERTTGTRHLLPFVHRWINKRDIPPHIEHMLICLSKLSSAEMKRFRFYEDEIYVMPEQRELWRLKQKKFAK